MKRIKNYGNLLLICILGFIPASLMAQDGREIMEQSREVSRLVGLEAVSTLKIVDPKGRERIRQT